jgi:murein DD-endopeptidase MepM/ murein hydrolase activator NlpD
MTHREWFWRSGRVLVFLGLVGCGAARTPPGEAGGAVVQPVVSSRSATAPPDAGIETFDDVAGVWRGTLGTGAKALRLELTTTKLESGDYVGRLNSIDQGVVLRAHPVAWENGVLRFELKQVGGVFEGKLDAGLRVAEGSWVQSGVTQPLVLRRVKSSENETPAVRETKERPGAPFTMPFEVSVPFGPRVFRGRGARQLAYELRVTNHASSEARLRSLSVLDGETTLETFEGARLEALLEQRSDGEGELARLEPGKVMTVYVWLTLAEGARLPRELSHRLDVKSSRYASSVSVTTAATRVSRGVPLLHPPLRGGLWIAGNGPGNDSMHRRALTPVGGRARIAQRFATDWSRLDDTGKKSTGDGTANEHYLAYGQEVLAVGAGRVAAVVDGIVENTPGKAERAVPITLETIGGNLVALDLGGGIYAFYAHLIPGSLRVKPGDRVRPGQVLSRIGNSGNSTAPHLHFQLSTGVSILDGEGIPYELRSFSMVEAERGAPPKRETARLIEHECPMAGDVVLFGE